VTPEGLQRGSREDVFR